MIIDNRLILQKKNRIFFEIIHIGCGIGFSLNNNLIVLNIILYVALFFSFIEQVLGIFSLELYVSNIGKEFNSIAEFRHWENGNLMLYIKSIIFCIKLSIYFVLSLLTIKFFIDLSNLLIKIFLMQITCQIFIIAIFSYFQSTFDTNEIISPANTVNQILPTIEFNNKGIIDEECSICLDKNELEWISLPCEHKFHQDCLKNWFNVNSSCPICRKTFLLPT